MAVVAVLSSLQKGVGSGGGCCWQWWKVLLAVVGGVVNNTGGLEGAINNSGGCCCFCSFASACLTEQARSPYNKLLSSLCHQSNPQYALLMANGSGQKEI